MSIQTVVQDVFTFYESSHVVIEVSAASLTSDGGLLVFRELDERIGLTQNFADALDDPRQPNQISHTFLEMTQMRIYGIVAGYFDQNDHDFLRSDPIFKIISNRSPNDSDLASQPTLSRFENQISILSLKRLRDVFIDQFIASFTTPPSRLTIDFDAVDDAAYGQQQLVLFNGFYDQYQYLPLVVTCAENDQIILLSLRPGNVPGYLGAEDDLDYLVKRLQAVWPHVTLHIRADAGFGVPVFIEACERLHVQYSIGIKSNAVLNKISEELLNQTTSEYEKLDQEAKENERPKPSTHRKVSGFWYRARSWPTYRCVIVKAEANAHGSSRRFILSNRHGAVVSPEAIYDEYAGRGEAENRNKEFKCDLGMDRMSDHRFMANFFRLYLHAAAHNLMVQMRRAIARPPYEEETPADVLGTGITDGTTIVTSQSLPADMALDKKLYPTKQADIARRRYFNKRRQYDPLGEGQPNTWRMMFIKVAAEVRVSHRRVVVRLSSNWPFLNYFKSCINRLNQYFASLPQPA